MSSTISLAFQTLFESEVKQAYQRAGKQLSQYCRTRNLQDGDTYTFNKLGQGTANTKGRNGMITPLNLASSVVTLTTASYYAPEYIDTLDATKTSVNFRQEYARACANAIGRKSDQIIVDLLDANSGHTVLSAPQVMNEATALSVRETLRESNVPDEDTVLVISPAAWTDLMTVDSFASADYTKVSKFDNAPQKTMWLGFEVVVYSGLGTTVSGGTSYDNCYAWHRDAVGYGEDAGIQVAIDYVPDRASTLVNAMFSAGACVIEDAGIVEIQVANT